MSWLLATWRLDLLGPFPTAPGGFKFLIVDIDTFTKWIETEPLTKITSAAAKKFVRCNIFTRFSVPSRIITDNGTQFTSQAFMEFCMEHGTKVCFASWHTRRATAKLNVPTVLYYEGSRDESKTSYTG